MINHLFFILPLVALNIIFLLELYGLKGKRKKEESFGRRLFLVFYGLIFMAVGLVPIFFAYITSSEEQN